MKDSEIAKLEKYGFAGMDASQLGAIKSVADYYEIPLSPTKIYGMTGLAFLFILDEGMVQPNAGPQEPEIFRLARNLGVDIQGMHQYAEGETFTRLQAEAWEKARQAIDSKKPVFAKNLDIENQTSVVMAYDDVGYYTDSWHTGYEHCDDVIPWNILGLSRCPCINCVNEHELIKPASETHGLISLHWADPIPAKDEITSFKEAIDFVILLNDEGTYTWSGRRYFVGSRAYDLWIKGLESNIVQKYWFSLIMEVLNEARHHATRFLGEMKDKFKGVVRQSIEDAINSYGEISARCNILKTRYPYEQPRELLSDSEREETVAILQEIFGLEKDALTLLMRIRDEANNPAIAITNKVTEIYVHVSDYDRSMEWYHNVLGIPRNAQGGLDMEGIRIVLIESEKRNPTTHAVFNLFSTDINAAYNDMKSKGVAVDDIYYCPFEKTTSFHVSDPDGHLILIKDC